MKILVTGAAGFIGFHTARRLLADGHEVVGLDNLNDYYDVSLKQARLGQLSSLPGFRFIKEDLGDARAMAAVFDQGRFERVIHLGAQAGVRHSLKDPEAYAHSNLLGSLHILEGCRHHQVEHLVYASTSSVYGANTRMPYSVHHSADHPLSFYAATKRASELMAHSYSHLFGLPTTGLRFFTVYGPWGRPDMALFQFTQKILARQPIEVFNGGQHQRDFTYIDDIVEGIVRISGHIPRPDPGWNSADPDPATSRAPFRIFNIGNSHPVALLRYIEVIEDCLGIQAEKRFLPMQAGDVPETSADIEDLADVTGYRPTTPIEVGVRHFVKWYRLYYSPG